MFESRSGAPGALSVPVRFDSSDYWPYNYFVSLEIGTPAQHVDILVKKSPYPIVPYSGSTTCRNDPQSCRPGSFDPTKSTSQTIVSSGDVRFLTTKWFNTSGANQGDLFQDNVAIGGLELVNHTFGVDMGGGLSTLGTGELWDQPVQDYPPTLARQMVEQGDIASAAFSLALDPTANGSLLFGAIDKKKYTGDLVALDASHFTNGTYGSKTYGVALTSLQVSSTTGTDELLTTGTPLFISPGIGSLATMPEPIALKIYEEIGITYDRKKRKATVPCERAAAKDAHFTFQFHGPKGPQIRVPLQDYFVPIRYAPGLPRTGPDYDVSQHGDCEFKLTIKQGDILTLGKPFMRNAYTVYDQESQVFGLAQSSYSTDEDIVPFAKRGDPIPLSVPGPVVHPSGAAYNSNQTDLLDFPVAPLTTLAAAAGIHNPVDSQNESNTAMHTGLGVGIPLGVLLLGVAALEVWIWVLKRPVRLCGHNFGKINVPKEVTELEATTSDRPRSGSRGLPRRGESLAIDGGELDSAEKRTV
ncbi:Lysosomal aspartic protease [Apiospora sp. TS-2023a]